MKTLLESLPLRERPVWCVAYNANSCTTVELLAAVIGGSRQLEIAQELISHFGSVQSLARAISDKLSVMEGIGPVCAARLLAALELGQRFSVSHEDGYPVIQAPEDAAAVLMYRMQNLEQEYLFVLLLNTRNRLMEEPLEIYHGSLNASFIRVGELFRPAIRSHPASIILAHNHPSSDTTPSPEDVQFTRTIVEAGKMLDIDVLEHLILGHGRFVSLKSKGLGFD